MAHFLLINQLKPVDTVFFIICAVAILAIVGIYLLIPVINQDRYREQRENLKKREEAFKSNLIKNNSKNSEEVAEKEDGVKSEQPHS